MVLQGLKKLGFPFPRSEDGEGQWEERIEGLPENTPPDPSGRKDLISFPGRQLQILLGVALRQATRAATDPALTTRLGHPHPTPHLGWVSSA